MKKTALSLLVTISMASATDYTSIINAIAQQEVDKFRAEFADYNALVVDTSAAMIAMSNIDFFKHDGFSTGVGIATVHSGYGIRSAYALGFQYGIGDISINVKGSYKSEGEYIIGSGIVVGW